MTDTKYAIDPTAWMDEPIKADKWSNLYFFKDGTTWISPLTYASENEAVVKFKERQRNAKAKQVETGKNVEMSIGDNRLGMFWNNVSHAIQIPVKS